MKRKVLSILFVFLILLLFPMFSFGRKGCTCGSPAEGTVTSYWVGNDEDCCIGTADAAGYHDFYAPDEGSTYTWLGSEQITGNDAQKECCKPK